MTSSDDQSGERSLILILGDQLSRNIAALKRADPDRDIVLMAEVAEEAGYVQHHKKKIAFLFSAMRHFANELKEDGWQVHYVRLDDPDNSGSLTGEIERLRAAHPVARVVVTEPGEYRLKSALQDWAETADIPLDMLQDSRFLCSHKRFGEWAEGRKQLRMEYFYREMRRKTGLLMENGHEPPGGQVEL